MKNCKAVLIKFDSVVESSMKGSLPNINSNNYNLAYQTSAATIPKKVLAHKTTERKILSSLTKL